MIFSENFLYRLNPTIEVGFVVHDALSDFLSKYLKQVKIGLLVLAHASLIGIFLPQFARGFGSLAQNLLLFILLVSPLSKLFRMKLLYQFMSVRRELGIWFSYAAIVHGAGYMLDPDWFAVFIAPHATRPLSILPRYIFGIAALILTLPLLITSNNASLKFLKGNWKKVHWLAYPLFAFMLLHIFLPGSADIRSQVIGLMEFGVVFGGYVILKVLAKHNFLTPLREINEYVGRQYADRQNARKR